MAILDESPVLLFQGGDLKVDDDKARQLYAHSKEGIFDLHRETTADEITAYSILGVPCEITFGFHTKGDGFPMKTEAGVWVFSGGGGEFFGSAYEKVSNEADAPAILNRTIAHAIEHTTANIKFITELARRRAMRN